MNVTSDLILREQELSNDLKIIELCLAKKCQASFLDGLEMDPKRRKWIEKTLEYLRNPQFGFDTNS